MSSETNSNDCVLSLRNSGKKLQRIARRLWTAAVIIGIIIALASFIAIVAGFFTVIMATFIGLGGLVFAALFLLFAYIYCLALNGYGEIVSSYENEGNDRRR